VGEELVDHHVLAVLPGNVCQLFVWPEGLEASLNSGLVDQVAQTLFEGVLGLRCYGGSEE
jgi:hypothetical protein